MNLLEIIESHLGEINLWPSIILTYLFNDHPSPVRTVRLKVVITFFYGNDVPQVLALQFYNVCNGKASRFVLDQFHEWYHVWLTHRCKPHMAVYWNMRVGKFIHINGSLLNQSEPVLPEVSKMELNFGIDNKRFPASNTGQIGTYESAQSVTPHIDLFQNAPSIPRASYRRF